MVAAPLPSGGKSTVDALHAQFDRAETTAAIERFRGLLLSFSAINMK